MNNDTYRMHRRTSDTHCHSEFMFDSWNNYFYSQTKKIKFTETRVKHWIWVFWNALSTFPLKTIQINRNIQVWRHYIGDIYFISRLEVPQVIHWSTINISIIHIRSDTILLIRETETLNTPYTICWLFNCREFF